MRRKLLVLALWIAIRSSNPCAAQSPFLFEDPIELPAPINVRGVWDSSATLTPDGLTMYFTSLRNGWGIYVADRTNTDQDFANVRKVNELSLGSLVGHPHLSNDGLTLLGNGGPEEQGHQDIYIATRNSLDEEFRKPKPLEGSVTTGEMERWASLTPDGLELYFTRNPPEEKPPFDLMVATRPDTSSPFGAAVKLPAPLNQARTYDDYPTFSPDGLAMLFSSDRAGGFGGEDLWVSRREAIGSPWGEPLNLGPKINSRFNEWAPNLTPDGGTLYFTRYTSSLDGQIWSATLVPEPSTLGMILSGGSVLAWSTRRK